MKRKKRKFREKIVSIVYEPKWEWFQPPLWWCFRWAYKITKETVDPDIICIHHVGVSDKGKSGLSIKQIAKSGKNINQIQVAMINNDAAIIQNYVKEEK